MNEKKYLFFIFLALLAALASKAIANVSISEVLPDPSGKDKEGEWIEIYNNGPNAVDLSGWVLRDGIGQTKTFVFPSRTQIMSYQYIICPISQTKITLNNTGDIIELLSPDKQIQDKVECPPAKQGLSYSKINAEWLWTESITPGKENIAPKKQEAETNPNQRPKTAQANNVLDSGNTPQTKTAAGQKSGQTFLLAALVAFSSAAIACFIKKG